MTLPISDAELVPNLFELVKYSHCKTELFDYYLAVCYDNLIQFNLLKENFQIIDEIINATKKLKSIFDTVKIG